MRYGNTGKHASAHQLLALHQEVEEFLTPAKVPSFYQTVDHLRKRRPPVGCFQITYHQVGPQ